MQYMAKQWPSRNPVIKAFIWDETVLQFSCGLVQL